MQQKLTGINKLRTAQKSRVRSMPKQKGGEYLDLFLAQKRLERLERERENTGARSQRIDEDFEDLSTEVGKLQDEIGVDRAASPAAARQTPASRTKKKPRRMQNMKKMDLSY